MSKRKRSDSSEDPHWELKLQLREEALLRVEQKAAPKWQGVVIGDSQVKCLLRAVGGTLIWKNISFLSKPGVSTKRALINIVEWLGSKRWDKIVLWFGSVDIFNGVGADEISKNIEELSVKVSAVSPQTEVFVVGMLPFGNDVWCSLAEAVNSGIMQRNQMSNRWHFVEIFDPLCHFCKTEKKEKKELYYDKWHLHEDGALVAAWEIAKNIALIN